MSYKNISIGLITCKRDFDITKRMIRSIVDCTNHSQIEEIIIVWNESFDNKENNDFYQILREHLTEELSNKIKFRLFSGDNLLEHQESYTPVVFHVWQGQQYLKLRLGDVCTTEWLLIHDAKDYYYKKISHEDLFTDAGKAKQIIHSILPSELVEKNLSNRIPTQKPGHIFLYAWLVTAKLWHNHNLQMNEKNTGQNLDSIKLNKTLTETPYFFHVPTLKKMNEECDKILGGFYPMLFFCCVPDNQVAMFTEFYHYSNFVEQTQGGLDKLYQAESLNFWHSYVKQSKTY